MQKFYRIVEITAIILITFTIVSCGQRTVYHPEPEKLTPDAKMFEKAERLFNSKLYDRALVCYGDYVSQYPGSPFVPAAMLKIGVLKRAAGDFEGARQSFSDLIRLYPDSAFAGEALVETLFVYYDEGNYEKLIEAAAVAVQKKPEASVLFRIYALAGDAYMAVASPLQAVRLFCAANELASGADREKIVSKLKTAISALSTEQIAMLLDELPSGSQQGFFRFYLGDVLAQQHRYRDSVKVLNDFVAEYPDHEMAPGALSLIGELEEKSSYNRYTVGCLLPLTGGYGKFGARALQGIELALEEYNARNPESGIKVIIKDTESDAKKAVEGVVELEEAGVMAVIGPVVTAWEAAEKASELSLPLVTMTQKEGVASIGDSIFRNFLTPPMQVKALADYAFNTLRVSRFAILYPGDNYGRKFMNLFWDEVLAHGGTVTGAEIYNPGQSDFASPIKRLAGLYYDLPYELKKERNPDDTAAGDEDPEPVVDFDAVFIPDTPGKVGLILPQLAYHDINNVYLLGTNLWHSGKLLERASHEAQGAVMTDGFFVESGRANVRAFVKNYRDTFNQPPGFIDAVSFDTAEIVFEIVGIRGPLSRGDVVSELKIMEGYEGVTGRTAFNDEGEAEKSPYMLKVRGKGFVEIQPVQ